MQEQNFEKQVREKMEELSFAPSEPVWQKVEGQISKKKDRRRVVFWLLPLLVTTGIVATWMNKEVLFGSQDRTISTISVEQKTNLPIEQNPATGFEKDNNIENKIEDNPLDNVRKADADQPDNKLHTQTSQIGPRKNEPRIKRKRQIVQLGSVQANNKTAQNRRVGKPVPFNHGKISDHTAVPSENGNPGSREVSTAINETVTVTNESIEKDKDAMDSISLGQESAKQDTMAVKSDTAQTLKIASSEKKRKLRWSVRVAGGISGLASSAFKFLPVASTGVNSNAQRLFDQSVSPNFSSGPSNAIAFQHAPEVYSGFSASAGLDVKKPVSERLNLVAGVGYSYYSTRIYIGSKVNAAASLTLNRVNEQVSVNDYFLAASTNKDAYTNQYHFIDLPLGIEWKVFKKLPLQLHSGLTVSRLVTTNALYYSNQQNIYYEDERVFKKTQFSLYTDASYRILKVKQGSFYAGPQVQLGLSNLLKKDAYGNQHLFFAGLNAHFDF